MKNEKRVAAIAGRVLETLKCAAPRSMISYVDRRYEDDWSLCIVADLKALCASALTPASGRAKCDHGPRMKAPRRVWPVGSVAESLQKRKKVKP